MKDFAERKGSRERHHLNVWNLERKKIFLNYLTAAQRSILWVIFKAFLLKKDNKKVYILKRLCRSHLNRILQTYISVKQIILSYQYNALIFKHFEKVNTIPPTNTPKQFQRHTYLPLWNPQKSLHQWTNSKNCKEN